jgi:hypothetical protein
MKLRLDLEIGNEAMSEPFHVAAALQAAARKVERGELVEGWAAPIFDANGNDVGSIEVAG